MYVATSWAQILVPAWEPTYSFMPSDLFLVQVLSPNESAIKRSAPILAT